MSNQKQDCIGAVRIAGFLAGAGQVIAEIVRTLLVRCGCEVSARGRGLELQYEISCNDMKATLYFRNLYLEIATIDRDEDPLQFDEKLHDFSYFSTKASSVIRLKLEILLKLLKSDDLDKSIDEVFEEFKGQRIFIEKVNNPGRKNGTNRDSAGN